MSTTRRSTTRRVVFARVRWYERYDSRKDGRGPRSSNTRGRDSESENFRVIRGKVYGFVESRMKNMAFNLARLDARWASQVDDVLVIFVARHPKWRAGQRIVGWYDGATCFAESRERAEHEDGCYGLYNIVAPSSAAHLLDPADRERHEAIPRGGGAFNLSNVFYREYPERDGRQERWVDRAVAYVDGYRARRENANPPRAELRDAEQVSEHTKTRQPLPFTRDPELLDRALGSHAVLQNEIRRLARRHGFTPKQPGLEWPEFDIGWPDGRGFTVVEVKSLAEVNEVQQIRYAIGQLVDYRARLLEEFPKVRPVLAVEREPSDPRWVEVCRAAGITLVWPETLRTLFPARTRRRQ